MILGKGCDHQEINNERTYINFSLLDIPARDSTRLTIDVDMVG
jgi:hypothetical protein